MRINCLALRPLGRAIPWLALGLLVACAAQYAPRAEAATYIGYWQGGRPVIVAPRNYYYYRAPRYVLRPYYSYPSYPTTYYYSSPSYPQAHYTSPGYPVTSTYPSSGYAPPVTPPANYAPQIYPPPPSDYSDSLSYTERYATPRSATAPAIPYDGAIPPSYNRPAPPYGTAPGGRPPVAVAKVQPAPTVPRAADAEVIEDSPRLSPGARLPPRDTASIERNPGAPIPDKPTTRAAPGVQSTANSPMAANSTGSGSGAAMQEQSMSLEQRAKLLRSMCSSHQISPAECAARRAALTQEN